MLVLFTLCIVLLIKQVNCQNIDDEKRIIDEAYNTIKVLEANNIDSLKLLLGKNFKSNLSRKYDNLSKKCGSIDKEKAKVKEMNFFIPDLIDTTVMNHHKMLLVNFTFIRCSNSQVYVEYDIVNEEKKLCNITFFSLNKSEIEELRELIESGPE